MVRLRVLFAAIFAIACGGADPARVVYGPTDGRSFPEATELEVGGNGVLLRASELGLVTWPQLDAVPASVTVDAALGCPPDGEDCSSRATIEWSAAAAEQWYAVRFVPDPARAGAIDEIYGIPLSDGSYVWRIYRGSAPQVDRIVLDQPESLVRIHLTETVLLAEAATLDGALSVTQNGTTCAPELFGDRTDTLVARCSPSLDAFAPTLVHVGEGWVSISGIELPPVDVEIDFDEGAVPAMVFERALTPPLVPGALCAGVECETTPGS